MLYMVKLTDITEWDQQCDDSNDWYRESKEGKPSYHILNEKEYEDMMDACIPDDFNHYTHVDVLGKWEKGDLEGFLVSLLPKED
jgi:hypothetical protein